MSMPADPRIARHILVALDGTRHDGPVVEWAQDLAHASGARLTLLGVQPTHRPLASVLDRHAGGDHAVGLSFEERRISLASTDLALQADGLDVVSRVVRGDPADEIAQAAAEVGADLIILGSHDHDARERALLGSVGEKVLDRAPCDVLIARGAPRPRHILVAADETFSSERAASRAQAYASVYGGVCKRLHVPTPGGKPVFLVSDDLLARAAEDASGLIATGSRGIRRLERALFGSVSRDVLHRSRANVLIAKERATSAAPRRS